MASTSSPAPPRHPPPSQQQTGPPDLQHASTAFQASSPSSKRDLKSWWKGFKLPSKHQGAPGISALVAPSPHRSASIFSESFGPCCDQSLSPLAPESIDEASDGDGLALVTTARGADPSSRRREQPKLDRPIKILSWLLGSHVKKPSDEKNRSNNKLTSLDTRPSGIFGVPLRQSITYANVAISLIDEDGKSYIYGYVPIVVAKCGVFLKEKATGIQGIFRLSGSEKRIKELKTIFDSPDRYGKGLVWDGYTVHDASNVLRRYLNDLPEPVVPLDLYESFREPLRGATKQAVWDVEGPQFVDSFDIADAIAKYQQLITELPPLNRQLLLYLLDLLAVFAAKSDENRMNSQNLAAIFQPGMLSHPNHAMSPDEYRLNQCVIIFLIENQDHFLIGMQGTAADAETVQEVQKGTPVPGQREGVSRSASNASAGAENIAKDGKLRRNKSTSSRHSRQSNGGPSPGSPAMATTPTGNGLGRSNTVPSKKSPSLQPGRFPSRNDGSHNAVGPLTPVTTPSGAAAVIPPAVVEELATPPEDSPAAVAASRDLGADGRLDATNQTATPSKESRAFPTIFQRTATSDSERRAPKKLRKKKAPGSSNPSAQSSTTSLPHSAAISPAVEATNPLEAIPSSPPQPRNSANAGSLPITAEMTPSEVTPRASQGLSSNTLHPQSAAASGTDDPLKPKRSQTASLRSSFNEGSDLDQVDEAAVQRSDVSAEAADPAEKEKKRRWRLSRRRDDGAQSLPAAGSPRKGTVPAAAAAAGGGLGENNHAEVSTSSIGSGKPAQPSTGQTRRSFTAESSDPTLATTATTTTTAAATEAPSVNTEGASRESKDRDEPSSAQGSGKGLTGWIKTKYREAKENAESRRTARSPPPAGRGKSLDIRRPSEEAGQDAK